MTEYAANRLPVGRRRFYQLYELRGKNKALACLICVTLFLHGRGGELTQRAAHLRDRAYQCKPEDARSFGGPCGAISGYSRYYHAISCRIVRLYKIFLLGAWIGHQLRTLFYIGTQMHLAG